MAFHYINFSVLYAITSWTFKTIIWIHRQPWDTKETWSCLFLVTRHILFLSSHAQLLKPKLDEECVCQTLFMGIIFFKIVTSLKRSSIRTDSAEIRRATGISLGTAPLHPVYLRCHLHCRFTWFRSSLLCRRQPTLPPLPSRRPTVCRSQIGWVHRKSRGLDEVESAEADLRQDSIHVAWIQTAVGEDRHKDHNDRWTLSNSRLPPRISAWHSTVNWKWTCMSTTSPAAVFISWDTWDPSDDHFPWMPRKHWSIPSYQVVSIYYCNSIFYGATDVVVRRLQSVLNAAARLISNRRKFDHITPVLRDQLHWLHIRQRIDFKISVFVYNALHGRGPTYLSRTCNPVREVGARAHLRSAIRGDLTVPRTRTRRYGPRSFRVSGPVLWNSLPEDIRTPELSLERFKSKL